MNKRQQQIADRIAGKVRGTTDHRFDSLRTFRQQWLNLGSDAHRRQFIDDGICRLEQHANGIG